MIFDVDIWPGDSSLPCLGQILRLRSQEEATALANIVRVLNVYSACSLW